MKIDDIDLEMFVRLSADGRLAVVNEIQDDSTVQLELLPLRWEDDYAYAAPEELEPLPPYRITGAQARQIVRGLAEPAEFAPTGNPPENCVSDGTYLLTADDLLEGIRRMREDRISQTEFRARFAAIYNLSGSIGCTSETWFRTMRILDEAELLADSLRKLYFLYGSMLYTADDTPVDAAEFDEAEHSLVCAIENRGREPGTGRYPADLLRSIAYSFDCDTIDDAPEVTQRLFRTGIEALCEEGNLIALQTKGYCIYCGTKIYPQDWPAARDIFLEYYRKTGDASAANTLGYIFYYGRCSHGVPEYDRAFHYFSIGHAAGYHESTYKLADMFAHGYSVIQDEDTAFRLYKTVYDDTLERFRMGEEDGKFADAALRMGNCWLRGIGVEPNPEEAYSLYLQADAAIRLRVKSTNYYGDDVVLHSVREALREAREQFPLRSRKQRYIPPILEIASDGHRRGRLTWRRKKDGTLVLTAAPLPRPDEKHAPKLLVTAACADYCGLQKSISFTMPDGGRIEPVAGGTSLEYDELRYNSRRSRTDFFLNGKKAGTLYGDFLIFTAPARKKEPKSGRLLRLARILFGESGHPYEYLAEDESIRAGDRVTVAGYDGETEATVLEIRTCCESELLLPAERYRSIIRKCEEQE